MSPEAAKILPAVPQDDKQEIQHMVDLVEQYESFSVTNAEECQKAADVLREAKNSVKALEDRRKAITQPLDTAKKSVMNLFRPATDALSRLEKILKPKIANYYAEEERKRKAAEAEAEARARKERERLEKRAEAARDKGDVEKAENLEVQAATTVATAPATTEAKATGVSVRKIWKAKVTDPVALCKEIAAGNIPPTVLDFKQAELNKIASTWQNNREFQGLTIYPENSVASR